HEALPIPIEDAVIDWQVLSEREEEDGSTTRRILLVVAYRDLLDRYVDACKKAGIKLVGIDLEAFALLRAVAEPLPVEAGPSSAAIVVVAVGHDRSTFAVSDGRACEFTRVLDWGGAALNVALARAIGLGIEDGRVRAINRLPRDDRRRKGPSIPTPVAVTSIAGFTLVAALLGLLFVSAQGTLKSRRLELAQKQQELAAIPVPA